MLVVVLEIEWFSVNVKIGLKYYKHWIVSTLRDVSSIEKWECIIRRLCERLRKRSTLVVCWLPRGSKDLNAITSKRKSERGWFLCLSLQPLASAFQRKDKNMMLPQQWTICKSVAGCSHDVATSASRAGLLFKPFAATVILLYVMIQCPMECLVQAELSINEFYHLHWHPCSLFHHPIDLLSYARSCPLQLVYPDASCQLIEF